MRKKFFEIICIERGLPQIQISVKEGRAAAKNIESWIKARVNVERFRNMEQSIITMYAKKL